MTFVKPSTTFGVWVRTRRRQLDLTQAELGKRAGCSEAAIRKIEADERKPSRQLAELLSRTLEIPHSEREMFLQFARGMLPEEFQIETRTNPHNLPVLLTSTIDRTHDLAAISGLLQDETVHLVTLIGPPGIGKTRLSIHTGQSLLDRFPDGAWFVDLADTTNPDFFLPTLARSLPDLPASPDISQLIGALKDRQLLLILDNFEQIVEKASLDVAQILKSCPNVRILVTSRIPLHVYGEYEYPVPALSIPARHEKKRPDVLLQFEAVQLFVARACQHQPQFKVTSENAAAVIDLCMVLDGIPLALELAAATLRRMTLNELVSMLKGWSGTNWVRQVSTPARDIPPRQRTLENVIDWSYALLDGQQRDFFSKLGVFSGWFDAEAAAVVCEAEPSAAREMIDVLTDQSLLQREILDNKTFWHMLELIREYAVTKPDPALRARVEQRRAEYFSEQLQVIRRQPHWKSERESYYQVNASNLLASLNYAILDGRTELGFQLVELLDELWWSLGYMKEGLELVHRLMALPDDSEPRIRASRLQMASDLAWQQHDFKTALAFSRAATELGREHGLKDAYPWYLNRLGRIYIEQENFSQAKDALKECLDLAYVSPEILNPGSPLAQLGEIALFEERLEEAKSLLLQALSYLKEEDDIFLAMAKTDLAEIALMQRDNQNARNWLEQAYGSVHQQIRRLLVYLCTLAGYLVLLNQNMPLAVHFYAAIDALQERSGVQLNSFYQRVNRERMLMAHENFSEQEWREIWQTGRGWDREVALRQVGSVLNL
jgi:predicted ATPase/DNA-binding XRE family transcriptional regulator